MAKKKGVYLLPNLLTTAALFCGFYAILAAINSNFETAAIAIFVAMILDGLDGRVARMINAQSDFGAEYDSLSDLVSFGLAPALIVYLWALVIGPHHQNLSRIHLSLQRKYRLFYRVCLICYLRFMSG